MSWFLRGLRLGILTEELPTSDVATRLSPGLPASTTYAGEIDALEAASICPTRALSVRDKLVEVDEDRCVECMRCKRTQMWRRDVAWAHGAESQALPARFSQSVHVRIVDAGDCGACLNELAQLNGPLYNLHRYGIFITPTPRQADVLLVVGPVTRQLVDPLRNAYDAMPTPKRVIAVGACAASGGVFGPSLMCGAGAAEAVPVDLIVPGCPPPPLAIIRALLKVCGQEPWR